MNIEPTYLETSVPCGLYSKLNDMSEQAFQNHRIYKQAIADQKERNERNQSNGYPDHAKIKAFMEGRGL